MFRVIFPSTVIEKEMSCVALYLKTRRYPQKHSILLLFLKQNLPNFEKVKRKKKKNLVSHDFFLSYKMQELWGKIPEQK